MAHAKAEFDPNLEKICDNNHTKKNFISKLYELKKEKKYKGLTPMTIRHLKKLFSYAVDQNKENASQLQSTLKAIVPHVFGNKKTCHESWCTMWLS